MRHIGGALFGVAADRLWRSRVMARSIFICAVSTRLGTFVRAWLELALRRLSRFRRRGRVGGDARLLGRLMFLPSRILINQLSSSDRYRDIGDFGPRAIQGCDVRSAGDALSETAPNLGSAVFLPSSGNLVPHAKKRFRSKITKQYGGDLKNKVNGIFPATVRKFPMSKVSVLAALGLCTGAAHAQSSVTMYGSLDGGLRNVVNGTKSGGAALTMASNGVYDQNRWGLRGVEDLGDGLKAVFNLEAGYILSTGALDNANGVLFQRRSTVGLEGAFGRVDVGRQFALQHYLIKDFEPFDFRYLGITEAAGVTNGNSTGRDNNDIYYTGVFGPTVFRAEYALGGVAGSLNDGSTRAVGFNYRTQTLKFGFGYTYKSKQIVAGTGPYYNDNEYTAGGAYTLGPVTALAGWSTNMQDTATSAGDSIKNQYLWGGVRYQVNPFIEIIGAYYDNKNITAGVSGRKDVSILSVTYNLSKRTILYADVDYTKFRGGLITNVVLNPSTHPSQTGISFGINHRF